MNGALESEFNVATVAPVLRDLILDAAVRERFRPSDLLAGWAARQEDGALDALSGEALNVALSLGEATGGPTEAQGGQLPLAMRRAVLEECGIEAVRNALDRDPPQTLTERVFATLVKGEAPDPVPMDRSMILALATAASWADGLDGATQVPKAEVEQRLHDSEFVERVGGVDLGLFVGRDALLRALARLWALPDRPVVLIEGPGGIGKSIAVARFFQSLLSGENGLARPDAILLLDFDLPNMQVAGSMDLAAEIVQQLALRWAKGDSDMLMSLLRGLRSRSNTPFRGTSPNSASQTAIRSRQSFETPERVLAEALARFADSRSTPLRLVLFADSFERAERLDELASGKMAEIVIALRDAGADVMAIYAARAFRDPAALGLGQRPAIQRVERFAQGEAVDYLVKKAASRGIALSRRDADRANRSINGWPLGLRIAVSMLGSSPKAFDAEKWLAELSSAGSSEKATLYERLLNRIVDLDLRKLAKPGLLVRRISDRVIERVLAGPCGLPDNVDGAELMRRAENEGQLFVRDLTDPGALWHRQDLREVMLPALRAAVPAKQARAIHDSAVAFYERETGDIARAEELYHRLSRGDARQTVAARWRPGAGLRLGGAVEELPPAAAATVRLLLGGGRSDKAGMGAGADIEELRAVARNRLADGDTRLSELFARGGVPETITSSLGDIRAEVLAREGHFEEVMIEAVALRGNRRVPSPVKARVAITAAGLAEGLLDFDRAAGFWTDARRLSRHLQPLEQLTVRVGLARVLRKTGAEEERRWRQARAAHSLLLAEESAVRSHSVLRLEAVAELSDILPLEPDGITPELARAAGLLLSLFRLLSPMYPSAMQYRARIDEVAQLLGEDPEYVHSPYDLDKITAQLFNAGEPASHARALAALRSEVDASFAAAVGRGAAEAVLDPAAKAAQFNYS